MPERLRVVRQPGAVHQLAAALRGQALPWAAASLALAGNVLLGFAVAFALS